MLPSGLYDTSTCDDVSNTIVLDRDRGQGLHGLKGHANFGTGCTSTILHMIVVHVLVDALDIDINNAFMQLTNKIGISQFITQVGSF